MELRKVGTRVHRAYKAIAEFGSFVQGLGIIGGILAAAAVFVVAAVTWLLARAEPQSPGTQAVLVVLVGIFVMCAALVFLISGRAKAVPAPLPMSNLERVVGEVEQALRGEFADLRADNDRLRGTIAQRDRNIHELQDRLRAAAQPAPTHEEAPEPFDPRLVVRHDGIKWEGLQRNGRLITERLLCPEHQTGLLFRPRGPDGEWRPQREPNDDDVVDLDDGDGALWCVTHDHMLWFDSGKRHIRDARAAARITLEYILSSRQEASEPS